MEKFAVSGGLRGAEYNDIGEPVVIGGKLHMQRKRCRETSLYDDGREAAHMTE